MVLKKEIKIEGYPLQMEFITDTSNEAAFVAGVGAGKTHAGALKMLDRLLNNPGASGLVTFPSYRIGQMATIEKYGQVFPQEIIKSQRARPYPVWELITGGSIYFFSTDNPNSIVGGEVAFVHMDEASLSLHQAYMNCKKRMRQRDKSGVAFPYQLWVTTTPKQLNWVYLEFGPDAPKEHKLFQASTRDNLYRDRVEIEEYIQKMGLSEREVGQEIEGKFEILAGDCLFKKEDLEKQLHFCNETIETRNGGQITIYKEPVVGVKYVAGADCYDGGGAGANCCIIMDKQTGDEVAEIYSDTSADKFSSLIFDLCSEYNNALVAPERNGTVGGIVITKLSEMGYPNIYIDDKGKMGWYTSTAAIPPKIDRLNMLKEYEEAVRLRQTVIRSSDAIGEMSTFVKDKTGKRYQHLEGRKDDRVMARAICWQVRKTPLPSKGGFGSVMRLSSTYAPARFGR